MYYNSLIIRYNRNNQIGHSVWFLQNIKNMELSNFISIENLINLVNKLMLSNWFVLASWPKIVNWSKITNIKRLLIDQRLWIDQRLQIDLLWLNRILRNSSGLMKDRYLRIISKKVQIISIKHSNFKNYIFKDECPKSCFTRRISH